MKASELRKKIAEGNFDKPTTGFCTEYVQTNLVVMPQRYADEFEIFCRKNSRPLPILEKIPANKHHTTLIADKANLLTDISRYEVFIDGKHKKTVSNIESYYQDDFVFFLLGCSFTFEQTLIEAGIAMKHIAQNINVAMYNTNIPLIQYGCFKGNMVVSMRPIHYSKVTKACVLSSRYPLCHGAPIHIGCPELIGIKDINQPDYGDVVTIESNEIPVFWACGVSGQKAIISIKSPIAITHSPGYMFVSDVKNKDWL